MSTPTRRPRGRGPQTTASGVEVDRDSAVTEWPVDWSSVTEWFRDRPHLVVSLGLLVGMTLGYWSKRR